MGKTICTNTECPKAKQCFTYLDDESEFISSIEKHEPVDGKCQYFKPIIKDRRSWMAHDYECGIY